MLNRSVLLILELLFVMAMVNVKDNSFFCSDIKEICSKYYKELKHMFNSLNTIQILIGLPRWWGDILILRNLHSTRTVFSFFLEFWATLLLTQFWFCVLATQWQLIYEAEVTWTFVLQKEKLSMYDNVISWVGFFFSPEDKSFLFPPTLLFVIFLQALEEKEGKNGKS